MKFLSFLKYLMTSTVYFFADKYRHYYYGRNSDVRYYRFQLFKIKNRRKFVNEDYKKNFSDITFRVAERMESYRGNRSIDIGSYFEFGVFNGDATINFWIGLNAYYRKLPDYWNIYLFDSFEGMPKNEGEKDVSDRIGPGDLRSSGSEFVIDRLQNIGIPRKKIHVVEGFYEDSLSDELQQDYVKQSIKPHFVNIDCDFHSSTLKVLKWLEPMMEQGTIVYFDDLDLYYRNPNKGEIKAINDFNELDPCRGLAVDNWIDPASRCYLFWRDDNPQLKIGVT